jgi:histidine triad (HIT) family protein
MIVWEKFCLQCTYTPRGIMKSAPYCVFCRIAAGEEPANIIYEDEKYIVIKNVLRWVPVMLLAMTKEHLLQEELWADIGDIGEIAARIGKEVSPQGFRLVSNFGHSAMQSQEHGHVHIVGGTSLGPYV